MAGVLKTAEKCVHFNVPGVFVFVYKTTAFTDNVGTGLVSLLKSIANALAVFTRKPYWCSAVNTLPPPPEISFNPYS